MLLKILITLSIFILVFVWRYYNSLVKQKNMRDEAWSGIDVQLKRRHDLIPSLIEVVKAYSKHEKETLESVVKLRNLSVETNHKTEKEKIEKGLVADLKKIFALSENYPDLKANKSFLELQENLSKVEDDIQYSRRYYNGTVRDNNILVESFPSNIIAKLFNFRKEEFFELEFVTERRSPKINF